MTGILLDTNFSRNLHIGHLDQHVDRWVKARAEESLSTSVLTVGEVRRRIELSPARQVEVKSE